MIPKTIHFNWIGDINKMPDYAKRAMDLFQKMNPDFTIDFFHISLDNFFNILYTNCDIEKKIYYLRIYKSCLKTMKKESSLILDQIDKKLDDISQISSSDILGWFSGKNFCVRLSDEFRFNSLYNNGGIWCDLDCIPLKPFDDRLLANTFFRMKNHNKKQDIFFMGCEPKKLWDKQCYVIENPFYYSDLRSMGTMMKEMKLAPEYVYNLMSKRNTPRDIIDDQYVIHLSIGDKFN